MVLFTSRRPLGRCENITAVYNAYDGEKQFIREDWKNPNPRITNGGFSVMVADDFVTYSPGKLIMIGHGASGGKSYGLNMPHAYHSASLAGLIDFVVSTSEETRQLEAEQAGVPIEKVLPLGMPRMDAYVGCKKGDGGTEIKKRMYLYVPTFRKPYEPPMPKINWKYIDEQLTDDEVVIVKPHMVTKRLLYGKYRHIFEVSSKLPSTPYLIDSDVVITDYSSILFDAHVLGKPVVLFEKRKGFVEKRGMSYPYPEGYASRYATDEVQLIRTIRTAKEPQEADIRCRQTTCGACDGQATKRVVELIRSLG